jgi:hypothetical protein
MSIPSRPAAIVAASTVSKFKADVYQLLVVVDPNERNELLEQYIWCSQCKTQGWSLSNQLGNTSNYQKHLETKHGYSFISGKLQPKTINTITLSFTQQNNKVEPFARQKIDDLNRLLALAWVSNSWSFNSVDDKAFLQFIDCLTDGKYSPPGRTKLTKIIDDLDNQMSKVLIAEMADSPISLTTDGGSMQNGVNYQAVTASLITPQFVPRDMTLAVQPTDGSQTAVAISGILDDVLDRYKLGSRKCVAACTDNCSTVVNAIKVNEKIDHSLTCVCHLMNLALMDVAEGKAPKTKPIVAMAGQPEQSESESESSESSDDSMSEESEGEIDQAQQIRINQPPITSRPVNHFQVISRKARELVSHFNRSPKLNALFIQYQERMIAKGRTSRTQTYNTVTFIDTRFVAHFFVFDRLLLLRTALDKFVKKPYAVYGKQKKQLTSFTADEWQMMNEYNEILKLFHINSTTFEASKGAPLGLVGARLALMLDDLDALARSLTLPVCAQFACDVGTKLRVRLSTMMNLKMYQLAFALDPRVHRRVIPGWSSQSCEDALRVACASFRWSDYVECDEVEAPPVQPAAQSSAPAAPSQARGTKRKLNDCPDRTQPAAEPNANPPQVLSKVDQYLLEQSIDEDACPFAWWKEKEKDYPTLARMARVYLSLPCSSASSERVFSCARLQLDYKRRRLDVNRVATLVCMNRNLELFIRLTRGDEAWDKSSQVRWWGPKPKPAAVPEKL